MGARVRITGWEAGLEKVEMTKAIRRATELGLKGAKECTDGVLGGEVLEVEVRDCDTARRLAAELRRLGAVAEVAEDED